MKNIFTLKPTLSIIGLAWFSAAMAAHPALSGGDGTSEAPYQIATQEDLVALSDYANNESDGSLFYYVLTADIDMSGIEFEPINNYKYPLDGYKVNFDGNNHKISNLTIAKGNNYCGLFGKVSGNHLSVQNLTIENINIDVETDENRVYVGGIVAFFGNPSQSGSSSISNCKVSGEIVMNNYIQSCVGGIVGYGNNIDITNCKNYANIGIGSGIPFGNQDNGVGGIIGKATVPSVTGTTHLITQCANFGNVTGPMNVGGIAGYTLGISANKNNNAGHITFHDGYAGGIIGNANSTLIDFSCNIGAVTISLVGVEDKSSFAARYIGGIAGYTNVARTVVSFYPFADNLNAGYIDGWDYTGGICGFANGWAYNNINVAPITDGSQFVTNCVSGANIGSYPLYDKENKNPFYGGSLYDKQMSILPDSMDGKVFEGKEQTYALYTEQLLNDSAYKHFVSVIENQGPHAGVYDWIYNEGVYAVPNDIDPDFNVLASAVIKLDSSDRVNNINHPFEVITIGNIGDGPTIESASKGKICKVSGKNIELAGTGNDTLRINYKGMVREIPVTVKAGTQTYTGTPKAQRPTVYSNVYTPSGQLVRKQAVAEQPLEGLKQGIYVVGNKKMIKTSGE